MEYDDAVNASIAAAKEWFEMQLSKAEAENNEPEIHAIKAATDKLSNVILRHVWG